MERAGIEPATSALQSRNFHLTGRHSTCRIGLDKGFAPISAVGASCARHALSQRKCCVNRCVAVGDGPGNQARFARERDGTREARRSGPLSVHRLLRRTGRADEKTISGTRIRQIIRPTSTEGKPRARAVESPPRRDGGYGSFTVLFRESDRGVRGRGSNHVAVADFDPFGSSEGEEVDRMLQGIRRSPDCLQETGVPLEEDHPRGRRCGARNHGSRLVRLGGRRYWNHGNTGSDEDSSQERISAKFVRAASGIINETNRVNAGGAQNDWTSADVWLQFRPLTGPNGTGTPTPNPNCDPVGLVTSFSWSNDPRRPEHRRDADERLLHREEPVQRVCVSRSQLLADAPRRRPARFGQGQCRPQHHLHRHREGLQQRCLGRGCLLRRVGGCWLRR